MKEIFLTQNQIALIDDDDYEMVSLFKWNAKRGSKTYYASTTVCFCGYNIMLRMHRLLLNAEENQLIDHINGNGLDNRKANLRFCTPSQNSMNRKPLTIKNRKPCYSLFKGVSWRKDVNLWVAYIRANNIKKHIGYFSNEKDAAQAYNVAAKGIHGEFAFLNKLRARRKGGLDAHNRIKS